MIFQSKYLSKLQIPAANRLLPVLFVPDTKTLLSVDSRKSKHIWNLSCFSDIVLETPLDGDKVQLPSKILSQYIESNELDGPANPDEMTFPITFKITANSKELIVSVLDFSADENNIYLPQWIMYNLYPLSMVVM